MVDSVRRLIESLMAGGLPLGAPKNVHAPSLHAASRPVNPRENLLVRETSKKEGRRMNIHRLFALAALVTLVGCDKAKADFERCIKLEQTNDPEGALQACDQAAKLDPNSKSGEAAAAKVLALRSTVLDRERANAEAELKERMKSATPARQAANDQAMQSLRAKIHRDRTFRQEDDHCAGEGKPGHSYRYGGGTYGENESLAGADGCVPYDDNSMRVAGNAQNHFCCP
jgi:hypothetical protein